MPTTITAHNMLNQSGDLQREPVQLHAGKTDSHNQTAPSDSAQPEMQTQCLLSKGRSYRIHWMPSALAEVGRRIKLRVHGKWDEGWVIRDVWDTRPVADIRKS